MSNFILLVSVFCLIIPLSVSPNPVEFSEAQGHLDRVDLDRLIVQGNYLYGITFGERVGDPAILTIINISDPTQPHIISRTLLAEGTSTSFHQRQPIILRRGILYYQLFNRAMGYVGLVDVSNPESPRQLSTIPGAQGFAVVDSYVFSTSDEFRITDVRDPENPVLVSTTPHVPSRGIVASPPQVYLAAWTRFLMVLDATNPRRPRTTWILRVAPRGGEIIKILGISNQYLYVWVNMPPRGAWAAIVDISATPPRVIGTLSSNLANAFIIDNRLYSFTGRSQWDVYDLSDPLNPDYIGNIGVDLPGADVHDVYLEGWTVANDWIYAAYWDADTSQTGLVTARIPLPHEH